MLTLEPKDYHLVTRQLSEVPVNNLFARAVIEHHVKGTVLVDSIESPKTFLICHPYGMSLLFGNVNNDSFNDELKDYALNTNGSREKIEWLQASPAWDSLLDRLFEGKTIKLADNISKQEKGTIETHTRVNFKFNSLRYKEYRKLHVNSHVEIVRTDKQIFHEMKGTVVPSYFWNDADHFLDKSIGFTALHDGRIAATAYAAFIIDKSLEIGIETVEEFRGMKLAQVTCSSLIDYAIENN